MNSDKVSKFVFIVVVSTSIVAGLTIFGMWNGYHRTRLFRMVESTLETLKGDVEALEETDLLTPSNFIQASRYEGEGVTINTDPKNDDYILLSGFFDNNNEIRLITRDGTVIRKWPLLFSEIVTDTSYLDEVPANDWSVDTHGALAMPDGSIVFNFEYSSAVRIDRCGKVLWTLKRQAHHSVERAEQGGFWIPGQRVVSELSEDNIRGFGVPYIDPTVMRVDEAGNVLEEISIPRLFVENGMEPHLASASYYFEPKPKDAWGREIVHLNKVDELTTELAADFPLFEAGDLALSMRNLNMVLVFSPTTHKIKWWRIGPWIRQHDVEFARGGWLMVFNNNIYLNEAFDTAEARTTKPTYLTTPRISNILAVNPQTDETRIIYGGEDHSLLSVIRGKVDETYAGHYIITEFDGGRVFEIDRDGNITWQYINRYDEGHVTEVTEGRVYPKDYFKVQDWSCQ